MKLLLYVFAFIVILSVAAEYLINRQSNSWLTALFAVIAAAAFYLLIYKPLKKLKS